MSKRENHDEPGTRISFDIVFDDGTKESNTVEINHWDLSLDDAIELFRRVLLAVGYAESLVNEYFNGE